MESKTESVVTLKKVLWAIEQLSTAEAFKLQEELTRRVIEAQQKKRGDDLKLANSFLKEAKRRGIYKRLKNTIKKRVRVTLTVPVELDWEDFDFQNNPHELSVIARFSTDTFEDVVNKRCARERGEATKHYVRAAKDFLGLASEMGVDLDSRDIHTVVYDALYHDL